MKASLSRILVGLLATAGLVGASVNAQAAGIGTGQSANEGQQPVTIVLTVAAHQMGNCSMGTCTASNVHTLVVTY